MPRKKKTIKIDLRAKIIGQLLDVTGLSIDSWNPAIISDDMKLISDDMKLISYIRNISDTWNPSQLNEALKLLGFRTVDTWNPAQLEETKNNLVQYFLPKIATGNPIELNLAGNFPYTVESAKVTMLPIQSGSGDPSPENVRPISGRNSVDLTRTGKNLFDGTQVTTTAPNNWEVTFSDNKLSIYHKNSYSTGSPKIRLNLQNGSYIISYNSITKNNTISFYIDEAYNTILVNNSTFTIESGHIYELFFNANPNTTNVIDKLQVELGTTATDYEPYNGQTYTATFPSTVYGGEYEFVSGKLSDEWVEIEKYDGEALPGEWISDRDAYAEGTTPTIGAQVVYKTTPTTTTLTPQAISLNKGENVINSDADNIELNYKINLN